MCRSTYSGRTETRHLPSAVVPPDISGRPFLGGKQLFANRSVCCSLKQRERNFPLFFGLVFPLGHWRPDMTSVNPDAERLLYRVRVVKQHVGWMGDKASHFLPLLTWRMSASSMTVWKRGFQEPIWANWQLLLAPELEWGRLGEGEAVQGAMLQQLKRLIGSRFCTFH